MTTEPVPQLWLKVLEGVDMDPSMSGAWSLKLSLVGSSAKSRFGLDGSSVACGAYPLFADEFLFHILEDHKAIDLFLFHTGKKKEEELYGRATLDFLPLENGVLRNKWLSVQPLNTFASTQSDESVGHLHVQWFACNVASLEEAQVQLATKPFVDFGNFVRSRPDITNLCASVAPTKATDRVAAALVNVYQDGPKALYLLKSSIEEEVQRTNKTSVLFRSNSMAMKLVSAYAKLIGKSFIKDTLGPLATKVLSDKTSYEINANRLPADSPPDLAQKNLQHIQDMAEKYLEAIMGAMESIPDELRTICSFFKNAVEPKFDDFWPRSVGGFFFLRYICPAVVSPTSVGMLISAPPKNPSRVFVLVAKVLQNIANATTFNETSMMALNAFVGDKIPIVRDFFVRIANSAADSEIREHEERTGPLVLHDSMHYLADLLHSKHSDWKNDHEDDRFINTVPLDDLSVLVEAVQSTKASVSDELPYKAIPAATLKGKGGVALGRAYKGDWDEDVIVLNAHQKWTGRARSATDVAFDLASRATHMLRGVQQHHPTAEFADWRYLLMCEQQFVTFCNTLVELQAVSLSGLDEHSRLMFWINVHNVLTFHLFCVLGSERMLREDSLVDHFYYEIGPFTFNLSQIRDGVLRGNKKRKRARRPIRSGDARREVILTCDPRIHFCLVTFLEDSPVLRPYHKTNLSAQLHRAGLLFCETHITVNVPKKVVTLPSVFDVYRTDFQSSKSEKYMWIVQFLDAKKLDLLCLNSKFREVVSKPSQRLQDRVTHLKVMKADVTYLMRFEPPLDTTSKKPVNSSTSTTSTTTSTDIRKVQVSTPSSSSSSASSSSSGANASSPSRGRSVAVVDDESAPVKTTPLPLVRVRTNTTADSVTRIVSKMTPITRKTSTDAAAAQQQQSQSQSQSEDDDEDDDEDSSSSSVTVSRTRSGVRTRPAKRLPARPRKAAQSEDFSAAEDTVIAPNPDQSTPVKSERSTSMPPLPSVPTASASSTPPSPSPPRSPTSPIRITPRADAASPSIAQHVHPKTAIPSTSSSTTSSSTTTTDELSRVNAQRDPADGDGDDTSASSQSQAQSPAQQQQVTSTVFDLDFVLKRLAKAISETLALDLALNAGRLVLAIKKELLALVGWASVPATDYVPPTVELSAEQLQFIPSAQQQFFAKLVTALYSSVNEISVIIQALAQHIAALTQVEIDHVVDIFQLMTGKVRPIVKHVQDTAAQATEKNAQLMHILALEKVLNTELDAILVKMEHSDGEMMRGYNNHTDQADLRYLMRMGQALRFFKQLLSHGHLEAEDFAPKQVTTLTVAPAMLQRLKAALHSDFVELITKLRAVLAAISSSHQTPERLTALAVKVRKFRTFVMENIVRNDEDEEDEDDSVAKTSGKQDVDGEGEGGGDGKVESNE